HDPPLFALFAGLPDPRRAARRRGERRVPAPAPATPRHDQLLPILEQLAQELAGVRVPHHRSRRHTQDQTRAVTAGAVVPLAVLTALRAVVLLVAVVEQRGEVAVGPEDDIAAATAVPPRRPAAGHALLPSERLGPRAARSAVHVDDRVVNEHVSPIPGTGTPSPRPSWSHRPNRLAVPDFGLTRRPPPRRRPRRPHGCATAPPPAPRPPAPHVHVRAERTRT